MIHAEILSAFIIIFIPRSRACILLIVDYRYQIEK